MLVSPITEFLPKSVGRCPVCDQKAMTKEEKMCQQCEVEITIHWTNHTVVDANERGLTLIGL